MAYPLGAIEPKRTSVANFAGMRKRRHAGTQRSCLLLEANQTEQAHCELFSVNDLKIHRAITSELLDCIRKCASCGYTASSVRVESRCMLSRDILRNNWPAITIGVTAAAIAFAAIVMLRSMPPHLLVMATGPEGDADYEVGERYRGPCTCQRRSTAGANDRIG
jgi:hypothetical protein